MKLWKEIERAGDQIGRVILRTPIIYSEALSKLTGKEIFLKLENLQKTGSFKIRGAYYKLSRLSGSKRVREVVAASAGNHAQGVAYASSLLGIHSTIVMPESAPLAKQMATRAYGGEVILFGRNTDEALCHARGMEETGRIFIHPFDDEEVIAGQGTIGLEILEDVPEVEGIIVPVGGGGLISGISTIVKKRKPKVRIIGVQSSHAPAAVRSLERKRIVEVKVKPTLADGIAVGKIGEITFPILQQKVDEMVIVEEEEIASAILMLMERKRLVAEGAGASPLAALLSRRIRIKAKKVVLVISGGNIDVHLLDRIIEKGLTRTGRMARFEVLLRDVPGSLTKLTGLVAQHHANILHIIHERAARDIPIGFSKVILVLETRGPEQIREIKKGLKEKGYLLQKLG
ncbi:MAG: threonine ammonia-lyase [Deltaproteobacteria bacterium]|nr:threonine ammonia-lyase [Deltaproteobacteria bacterium]MDP3017392.1 threonine ammonia-lyase [Deltaproteobacteria bacterium]